MVKRLRDTFEKLYEIADSQGGYFTAKQAAAVGYSTRMQTFHVQAGDWEREWRGIYRLHFYPNPRPDDLMVWYLWSCDRAGKPEGVYSHDTALEIHELSTWTGNRLHMTVPNDFRRSIVPESLRLHKEELRHFETTRVANVPVTTVVRTLIDLLYAQTVPRHHLIEAVQEAHKRGLLIQSDLKNPCWTAEERRLLKALEDESRSFVPEA